VPLSPVTSLRRNATTALQRLEPTIAVHLPMTDGPIWQLKLRIATCVALQAAWYLSMSKLVGRSLAPNLAHKPAGVVQVLELAANRAVREPPRSATTR
jgi:hypothetical protein